MDYMLLLIIAICLLVGMMYFIKRRSDPGPLVSMKIPMSARPEVIILNTIREKLVPLNFKETEDGQYPASAFRRGELQVRWNINEKDEVFVFMLREKDREIVELRSPWYIGRNEKAWNEFKEQVLKALDDWLKTI